MKITIGDTEKVYRIFENLENGHFIDVQFSRWNDKKATEITIVENNTLNFEILEVRYINVSKCYDDGNCTELHLKGIKGNPEENKGDVFKIINECEFDCYAYLIRYNFDFDSDRRDYKKEKCSCHFDTFEVPEKAGGRILRG